MRFFAVCVFSALASCLCAEYACEWKTGKGTGLKQVKIAGLSGKACVEECLKRKKIFKRINAVTERIDGKVEGCWCVHKLHDIAEGSSEFKTCHLEVHSGITETPKFPAGSGERIPPSESPGNIDSDKTHKLAKAPKVDFMYPDFKDKDCPNHISYFVGCSQPIRNSKLILNFRFDIEWAPERISSFSKALRCACATAAMEAGAMEFAITFWGECWAVKKSDDEGESSGCVVADGLYKTKCSAGDNCLGGTGYAVYKYTSKMNYMRY